MFSRFVVFFLLYNIFYSSTGDLYNTSWCNYTNLNGIDVHKVVAENLAYCHQYIPNNKQTNFAVFGISFIDSEGKCIGKSIHPQVLSSTYQDSTGTLRYDLNKHKILTIPDIFRGDELRLIRTSERLFDFLSFLASKRYTELWGLIKPIKTYSELMKTSNEKNYKIPIYNTLSRELHDLLHCEQLFLYECLKDNVIISNLLNNLPRDSDLSSLYSKAEFISFDIITYNDMCPKCFASCEGNFYDLESQFNRILLEKLRICGKLEQALGEKRTAPLRLKIRISSFKPYKESRTGDGYNPSDYLTYSLAYSLAHNPKAEEGRENIVQFFNPFITQHILNNKVNNFYSSVKNDNLSEVNSLKSNFDDLSKIFNSVFERILDTNVKNNLFLEEPVVKNIIQKFKEIIKKIEEFFSKNHKETDGYNNLTSIKNGMQNVINSVNTFLDS